MIKKLLAVSLMVLLCASLLAQQGNVSSQGRNYVEFEPLGTVAVRPGVTTPVQFTFHVRADITSIPISRPRPNLFPLRWDSRLRQTWLSPKSSILPDS